MRKKYAGIGPRDTPTVILDRQVGIARFLSDHGFICHTGGAEGADMAFIIGSAEENCKIWGTRDATTEAKQIAKVFHPAWDNCNIFAKALLGRNVVILLGPSLNAPVDFVMTWTPTPDKGGTAMGLRIAKHYKIPVCNMAFMGKVEIQGFLTRMVNGQNI